ncbi:MAG: methylmalonyl-CoA epimerase [Planctomycetes bacterium RBG_16_43_13]|nr:MAG: methylmalonyl-CoA epimerase [Planctomycetes bacterium RBG_16_43_13]
MNIKKVGHIGIAVNNCQKAANFFKTVLGLTDEGTEILQDMKLKVAKIRTSDVVLELLEPMNGEVVITKFLKKRGEGIHHICFEVDDIKNAMALLLSKGFKPLYDTPRNGANGKLVNFLKPQDTFGILVELNQPLKP